MNKKQLKGSVYLTLTAFFWGIAFVAASEGGDALGPFTFNCIRSLLGSVVLIPVIKILGKMSHDTNDASEISNSNPASNDSGNRILILGGIACGILMCLASNLQQMGLYFGTGAGKSGFLTATYIIMVPIIGLFLKRKCGVNVWISVIIALIGLYLLCMHGEFSLQLSDVLILLCALAYALHILVVGHFAPKVDGVKLSCLQFFVTGIITAVPMTIFEMKPLSGNVLSWLHGFSSWSAWIPLLYAGFITCGLAFTLQILGQKHVNPTVASLLMSLESVFAVIAGAIILGEVLSIREIIGCVLVFAAIILAQIPIGKK